MRWLKLFRLWLWWRRGRGDVLFITKVGQRAKTKGPRLPEGTWVIASIEMQVGEGHRRVAEVKLVDAMSYLETYRREA